MSRGTEASGDAVAPAASTGRPDLPGALLATAGMTLLVLGIVRTDLITAAIAVAVLAMFVRTERKTHREPLIRPGLLANRAVSGANLYNLLVGAAMAASFYFASLYLQRILGHGPARTGLEFLPFALGVVAGSVAAIKLGYRFPARTLLIIGGLLTAAGFVWFGRISADGTYLTDVLGPSILAGVGFGLCLGPVVSIATADVAAHETGTASSLLNSSRQIGASLGLAVLGTAADHQSDLTTGYALGLTLAAVFLLAAVLVAALVLPKMSEAKARVAP